MRSFLLIINSNLSPILHRLATIHSSETNGRTDRQTDRRTTPHANSSTFTKVRSAKNQQETEENHYFV